MFNRRSILSLLGALPFAGKITEMQAAAGKVRVLAPLGPWQHGELMEGIAGEGMRVGGFIARAPLRQLELPVDRPAVITGTVHEYSRDGAVIETHYLDGVVTRERLPDDDELPYALGP
jgi:hypothetical protein